MAHSHFDAGIFPFAGDLSEPYDLLFLFIQTCNLRREHKGLSQRHAPHHGYTPLFCRCNSEALSCGDVLFSLV